MSTSQIKSQISSDIWKTGSSSLAVMATIVAPLILGSNPAQADDFYQDPYHWNQHRSSSGPNIILTLPSQHRSTQSTTIFQNGQVIRIYEDSNSYRNPDRFFPFGNRRSVEFSVGNQGEFRQIERYPINTWDQPLNRPQWNRPQWNRPIEGSSFRYGFPNNRHHRW